ncbi:MAG: cytochrome c [Alphaproteobacteria bacterium]|nr:cytochrome c [Alphaproteobacteria bacterium]
MKTRTLIFSGALSLAAIAAAFAHGGATGIVKERMDAMSVMSKAAKTMSSMMRGLIAYDADIVRSAAAEIQVHAGTAMTQLFPAGSDGMPSEARPEIWSDWDRFSELAMRLEVLAEGLEAAAGNGVDEADGSKAGGLTANSSTMSADKMRLELLALDTMPANAVFNMIAQTCSACHAEFRLKMQ